MTANHPYPETVVTAVAKALWETTPASQIIGWDDLAPQDSQHADYTHKAHTALAALWDASRVDTLDQLDELPWNHVVIDRTGHVADDYVSRNDIDHSDLPAHVLYWRNHD